jgi:hypothetical protein
VRITLRVMDENARHPDSTIVGSAWRIHTVTTPDETVAARPGSAAFVSFGADGLLLGNDGVNAYNGQYHLEQDGYRAFEVASTLVGYFGDDVRVRAVTRAVRAATSEGAFVRTELDGDSLMLTVNGYELRCSRAG